MDEPLKAKYRFEHPLPQVVVPKEDSVATLKKWLTLHPKVQAAFVGLALVAVLNLQAAYDGTITYKEAVHTTVGALIVAVLAYLKKSNGSPV
jgi:predicted secreted protein